MERVWPCLVQAQTQRACQYFAFFQEEIHPQEALLLNRMMTPPPTEQNKPLQELDNGPRGLGAGKAGVVFSPQPGVVHRLPPGGGRQAKGALGMFARHQKYCDGCPRVLSKRPLRRFLAERGGVHISSFR